MLNRAARRLHLLYTLSHLSHTCIYQLFNLLGGFSTSLSKHTHLPCDNRKTTTLLTSTRRFDGSIQRQQISLEGNPVNHTNNVLDLARTGCDIFHRLNNTTHHLTSMLRRLAGSGRQPCRLLRMLSVLKHDRMQIRHRRCAVLKAGGLQLCAVCKICVTGVNLRRASSNHFS